MSEKPVVAAEVAELEFDRFLQEMGLTRRTEAKLDRGDADDRKAFADYKERLLLAMQDGDLIVDQQGQLIFTPKSGGAAITFREPTAGDRKVTDQAKPGHSVEKTILLLSKWTGVVQATFEKMKERDFAVVEAIVVLFFP